MWRRSSRREVGRVLAQPGFGSTIKQNEDVSSIAFSHILVRYTLLARRIAARRGGRCRDHRLAAEAVHELVEIYPAKARWRCGARRHLERFAGEHCLQWPARNEEDADRELREKGNQVDLCQCFRS